MYVFYFAFYLYYYHILINHKQESPTLRLFVAIQRGTEKDVENELRNNPMLINDRDENVLEVRMNLLKEEFCELLIFFHIYSETFHKRQNSKTLFLLIIIFSK